MKREIITGALAVFTLPGAFTGFVGAISPSRTTSNPILDGLHGAIEKTEPMRRDAAAAAAGTGWRGPVAAWNITNGISAGAVGGTVGVAHELWNLVL